MLGSEKPSKIVFGGHLFLPKGTGTSRNLSNPCLLHNGIGQSCKRGFSSGSLPHKDSPTMIQQILKLYRDPLEASQILAFQWVFNVTATTEEYL